MICKPDHNGECLECDYFVGNCPNLVKGNTMLTLSTVIGDNLTLVVGGSKPLVITFVSVENNKVRIGVASEDAVYIIKDK